MKRDISLKYLLVLSCLMLNSFSVATSERAEDEIIAKDAVLSKNAYVPLEFYPAALTSEVSKKLDETFTRFNKRHDFHGSVLVAHKGKVIFKEHYGMANFKAKKKIDDDSRFQLASVSKQFTAAAILILNERGVLNLDDEVSKFFPNFPYEEVKVRNLLNHTAGLPKYFWLAEHKWQEEHVPSNAEMMDLMENEQVGRYFRPGRNFDYSNTGYFVLSAIVEKVSGESFGDFLQKEIFEPLNMKDSYVFSYGHQEETEDQLMGYRLYRRRWHAPIEGTVNDGVVGDKNVYSTTEDLLKWVNGLNTYKILSKSSVEQMYTKGKTVYNREVPYGFGFRLKEIAGEPIVFHNGRWNGFSTSLMQYPERELTVITLEHSSYNSMKYLNKKVRDIVAQHFKAS